MRGGVVPRLWRGGRKAPSVPADGFSCFIREIAEGERAAEGGGGGHVTEAPGEAGPAGGCICSAELFSIGEPGKRR